MAGEVMAAPFQVIVPAAVFWTRAPGEERLIPLSVLVTAVV